LSQDERQIEGQENLTKYITNYYKPLFHRPGHTSLFLDPTSVDKIDVEDGEMLKARFTFEELKDVVVGLDYK
jgi:hypothetical protein